MVRLLLLLVSMLTVSRSRQRELAWDQEDGRYHGLGADGQDGPSTVADPDPWPGRYDIPGQAGWSARWPADDRDTVPERARGEPRRRPRRRRVPGWLKWAAVAVALGLIFRRAMAYAVLVALSAALHLVGVNVHLPHIKFAWPWQTIVSGSTTNTDVGPWVLQRIEGISRPALGRASFTFLFTHKVSKNIGPWPCWYSSTFYALGYASATVDLNPGPAWWAPATGHYRLRVLSRPLNGKPGHVTVAMVLPPPQLPQSVHDVTIDNIPSRPVATQHSWTYPGFGCGVLLRPQFAQSVLYAQAQQIAFYRSTHVRQITRPLISAAQSQATLTIRDNFIQPTVNAFGYILDGFTIRWAAAP